MSSDRLEAMLRQLHGSGDSRPAPTQHQRELEQTLTAYYQKTHNPHRRYLMLLNPWHKTTRLALIGLAMISLTVGACSTSTVTDVELGQKVTMSFNTAGQSYDDTVKDLNTSKALDEFLRSRSDIENVSLNINQSSDRGTTIELLAWGKHLDGARLAADLRARFPGLRDATIQTEPLSGTIEESLASHLKREIFQVEIDGTTEEEIRAQILAQLASDGISTGATVEVHQSDGQTGITIKVEDESGT